MSVENGALGGEDHRAAKPAAERVDLQEIITRLPVGMAIMNAEGVFIQSNQANDDLWGSSRLGLNAEQRETLRRGYWPRTGKRLKPEDWPAARALATSLPVTREAIDIERQGRPMVAVLATAIPLLDADGAVSVVVAITEDITEQRASQRLSDSLNDINRLVHSTLQFDEIVQYTLTESVRALGAMAGFVSMSDGEEWAVRQLYGLSNAVIGMRIPVREDITVERYGHLEQAGSTGDEQGPTPCSQLSHELGIYTTLTVPLRARDGLLGGLTLCFDSPTDLSESQLDFSRKLGSTFTAAIENARLYAAEVDAESRVTTELETSALLLEASSALAIWTEPDSPLQALADIMLKATRHSRVTVYTWHEETMKMRIDAVAGSSPLPLGMEVDFDDFAPGTRDALSAQETAFVDLSKVPPEQRPIGEAWGYCDLLAVPLVFADRLVGMIGIDNVGTHRPFTEREIKIAEGIAAQAAAAVVNADLFQRQFGELANTRLLQDIAVAGAEALRIGDVCRRVLEELHEHLDLQIASIYLLDAQAEQLVLAASIGYPEDVAQSLRRLPVSDDSNIGRLVIHQLAFLTHEHGSDPPGALERIQRLGLEDSRWIALPIKHGNDLLGVVSLVFAKKSPFSEQEIDLYRGVAATLGSAVSNAQLFEAERRARAREEVRASHLATLNAIAAMCLTPLSPLELASELLPLIKRRIGFSSATVRILSPGGSSLVLLACDGISPDEVAEPVDLSGDCVICDAFRTGEPIIQGTGSKPVPEYASQSPDAPRDGSHAFAVLPLVGPTQTLGMLTMSWRGPRAWPDERIAFLGAVANELAVGLENARLHEREREAARLAAAFAEINRAVHSTLDFDEIAHRALTEGARTLGAENATIAMRTDAGFLLSHTFGYPQTAVGSFIAAAPDDPYAMACLRTTIAIENVARDSRIGEAVAREYGLRSIISAPLVTRSAGSALLSFSFRTKTHSFSPAECDFVTNVAASLALALENASLFSAEVRAQLRAKEELDLSNLLLQAADTLSSSINLNEITEALCDVTQKHLRIDRIRVLLFDAEHSVFRVAACRSSEPSIEGSELPWGQLPAAVQDSMLQQLKTPIVIDSENDAHLPAIGPAATRHSGILYSAWVPIRTSGKHLGFVVADEPGRRHAFSARDLEIAAAFASQAAVSIQNAQLYQAEHHIAETLQHALLEVPEHIVGLEHGELYRSATETAHVGGDFYDLFEVDRGRIGVVIGDVSGKGLDAASLTATVRNTLRVHALEGLTPSTVVRKTNDLLVRFTPVEVFVTLFFGILDTRTGALSYVVAGHPAPLVMHSNGDVDELAGGSPIVGAFEGIAFEEYAATLRWADTLLLYTDGLAEVRCGAEQYGIRRVAAALTANHAVSSDLAQLVRLVCADAQTFSGGALNDDMAMMALRLQHGPGQIWP